MRGRRSAREAIQPERRGSIAAKNAKITEEKATEWTGRKDSGSIPEPLIGHFLFALHSVTITHFRKDSRPQIAQIARMEGHPCWLVFIRVICEIGGSSRFGCGFAALCSFEFFVAD